MSHGMKMKYFVLKPEGDNDYAEASRKAMMAYANSIKIENPVLADDLRNWVQMERIKLCPSLMSD